MLGCRSNDPHIEGFAAIVISMLIVWLAEFFGVLPQNRDHRRAGRRLSLLACSTLPIRAENTIR